MCLNALKCNINLFEEVPERFSENSKCDELGRVAMENVRF